MSVIVEAVGASEQDDAAGRETSGANAGITCQRGSRCRLRRSTSMKPTANQRTTMIRLSMALDPGCGVRYTPHRFGPLP